MALDTFLAFLGRRVAAFTAEAELTLRDVRETHAGDELYSKADVEAMFDEAQVAVRDRVRRDFETTVAIAALALQQVLSGNGGSLDMELTEDEGALSRMRDRLSGTSREPTGSRKAGAAGSSGLSGLSSLGGGATDDDAASGGVSFTDRVAALRREAAAELLVATSKAEALADEVAALKEELKTSKERHDAMAREAAAAAAAKAAAVSRAAAAEAEALALRSGVSASAAEAAAHETALRKLQDTVAELSARLETEKTTAVAAAREREVAVNRSKQFLQIKALLQRKNAQLTEARAKIARLETFLEGKGGGGGAGDAEPGDDGVVQVDEE